MVLSFALHDLFNRYETKSKMAHSFDFLNIRHVCKDDRRQNNHNAAFLYGRH